jgi:hypothetical protein
LIQLEIFFVELEEDHRESQKFMTMIFTGQSDSQISVAARKHKRSGLQTRQFVAHINCK